MQSARNALVAGGTGLVGRELLTLLGEENRYGHITSLVRREMVAAGRVENRVVSFDHLDRSELPEVDDAYCCLGTTMRVAGSDEAFRKVDFDYILAFARAAQRAGAVRFLVVSAMVANTIERVDPYTAGHGARTRKYCRYLAEKIVVLMRRALR